MVIMDGDIHTITEGITITSTTLTMVTDTMDTHTVEEEEIQIITMVDLL